MPGNAKIEFETVTYPQPAPGSVPGWRFPDGTVLVKTFALETEPGKKRRLETRLLVAERVGGTEEYGDQVWRGYTYVWNDDQTDAELPTAKGVDRDFTIKTAAGERKQKWHFPSRAECTMCHTITAKYALGVNTAQMNKDHDYGGVIANQLGTLEHLGIFDRKLPEARGSTGEARQSARRVRRPGQAGPLLSARQLQPLPSQVGRRQRRVPVAAHAAARRDRHDRT